MKTSYLLKFISILSFCFLIPLSAASNTPNINISPTTASITETDSGTTQQTLNISISQCPDKKDILVQYSTASVTAIEDTDFVKTDGEVTFSQSLFNMCTKSYEISIDINGDTDYENNETFSVNIQISANAAQTYTEGSLISTVTITNDDADLSNTPPVIDTIPDQIAQNSVAFNLNISDYTSDVDNDSISYSLTGGLPTGLDFNSTTGILDGTPDDNGTFWLSVNAIDKDGTSNSVSFNIIVSDPSQSSETINNANDLCYDSVTSSGFCGIINMMCTITTPIKSRSNDSLTDVQAILATTSLFSAFSDCGVDGSSGNCEDSTQMSMMGMSALNDGVAYTLPNYDPNDTHTTYTSAMFSFMNSSYEWIATYVKDGETYQGIINPCGTLLIEDPIFENCGIFPSALNTWAGITSANNDAVIYADTIYANEGIETAQGNEGSVDCLTDPSADAQDCNIGELDINPPTLPNFINSTVNDPYTALGMETDSQYGDLTIASSTSVTFDSNSTYVDNSRKIMLIKSLNIHENATITFSEGDYYIGEWTNAANLIVRADGPVRLYINANMILNNNALDFNYDNDTGIPSDMFIFIGGNFTMTSSGGGSGYNMRAFVFTNGTFNAGTNTNNSAFKGAITAVGEITLNNNQTYTYDDTGLDNSGFGDCDGGGTTPILGRLDAWQTSLTNRAITTKIVDKPFTLTLASLSQDMNATQERDDITVKYQLYNYDTNESITDLAIWNITEGNPTTLKIFSDITTAYKDIRVRFKYCQDSNTSEIVNYARCSDTGYQFFQEVASSDNFAIRPYIFSITPRTENLISAKDYNFTITAKNYSGSLANSYTISNSDYSLDIGETNYMPNGDINNSLNGDGFVTSFSFIDGNSSHLSINFDDIGKVNLSVEDREWASVDSDDTVADCTDSGRYICGDTNATFIPSHFVFTNPTLHNSKNSNFTYLSNDLNISANIALTITAKNDKNDTTINFDSASWENPVDINFTLTTLNTPPIIKSDINTSQKIGFVNGVKQVTWSETNSSKNLMFNFQREINSAINPFVVNGSEVTLNASSIYSSSTLTASPKTLTQNVTMLYGRTNVSRQRYDSYTGNAFIYYEVYCYTIDANSNLCDKTLLPNGLNSKHTNDLRWFINGEHNSSNDGITGVVTHYTGTNIVTATPPTDSNPSTTTLVYDKRYGYPYKTTMENNASTWLIHNRDDSTATINKFSVEFEGANSSWSGIHGTDSKTRDTDVNRVNRRSMW
ncbi:MAG: putative Ig domain-containing protein [Campylobacterota bacterium]|nr:putative Ig domain-containing protein [Campylobacterota bacterium]